jgi:hypothetical protein
MQIRVGAQSPDVCREFRKMPDQDHTRTLSEQPLFFGLAVPFRSTPFQRGSKVAFV